MFQLASYIGLDIPFMWRNTGQLKLRKSIKAHTQVQKVSCTLAQAAAIRDYTDKAVLTGIYRDWFLRTPKHRTLQNMQSIGHEKVS